MKFLRLLLLSFFAPCLAACAAAVGDVQLGVKSEEGPLEPVWITKTANRALGWNSSGILGPITISGGSGSSDWPDITNTPTTLAGYGITDSITAALAASTYQPLITDGSLTIARTSGLQAALDAKLSSATAASTYQTAITDGSLTIARTNGLQTAINAKLSIATAEADYLTIAAAELAYQPKSIALDELALYGSSTGGQWASDSVKLAKYGTAGELGTSGHLLIFGDEAANVTTLRAQAGVNPTVTLPSTTGTLALTTSNISGNAAGLSSTLAVASGGTGQTSFTNGQILIGNTTGNTLTKATLTAGSGITITNGSGSITIAATGGGGSGTGVYRNITVKASEMIPRVTNGPLVNSSESSTNKVNFDTLDFDPGTTQYAQVWVRMPDEWDAGTVKAKITWLGDSGSGDVVWKISAVAVGDNEAVDAAQGTAQSVTDTLLSSNVCVTSATAAITAGGTPAAGKWLIFGVSRDTASGSDTYGGNARLIGITVQYNESTTPPSVW